MWAGRQRNEYWNHLTPISLIGGFVAELLWAVSLSGESRLQTLVALVMALIPILPLFPPGVVGFYWYRRLWRRARRIRAHRDLSLLRRNVNDSVTLKNAQRSLSVIASRWESAAVALLLAGIAANGYLSAVLFALLMR
jgi:Na+/proline symporter